VQRIGEEARRASAAQTEAQRRAGLLDAARQGFLRVESRLASFIRAHAPATTQGGWSIRLGYARLDLPAPTSSTSAGRVPFDVIAYTEIRLDQANAPGGTYVGRSHSLWYCDARQPGQYAWFETAFMESPFVSHRNGFSVHQQNEPFSADPRNEVAQQAVGSGMGTYQVAWPFTALVDEASDEFVDRWVDVVRRSLDRPAPAPVADAGADRERNLAPLTVSGRCSSAPPSSTPRPSRQSCTSPAAGCVEGRPRASAGSGLDCRRDAARAPACVVGGANPEQIVPRRWTAL
jgi:hypothetical protein